jgi:hypothetical protein
MGRSHAFLRWAAAAAALAGLCLARGPSGAPEALAGPAKKTAYVAPKPTEKSQTQKTVDERGGVNPCNTKEPKPGVYEGWSRASSMGQMLMPARGGVSKDGRFDVIVHFHGHDPARKEWVQVMDGAVLVGIDLGIGSGAYSQTFGNPSAFKDLIASVETEVARHAGIKSAKARKIGVSAWSAGYGAVQQILSQSYGKEKVDAVILLDGLHVGYAGDGTLERVGLEPFIDFAKRAKAGKRFMFASHSSIIPPGYASTTETVSYLVHELGGKPKSQKARKGDPMGLELNAKFDAGNFHARGYDGNDKMDHCAHIGLLREVLKSHIKPRWKSPKGQAAKVEKPKRKDKAASPKAVAVKPADPKKSGSGKDPKKNGAQSAAKKHNTVAKRGA